MAAFKFSAVLCLFSLSVINAQEEHKPSYKYSYASEESMKTSASEIPHNGYQTYERGYYSPRYYGGSMKTSASEIPHNGYQTYEGGYYSPRYYGGYGGFGGGYGGPYSGKYFGGPWNPGFYPGHRGYFGVPFVGGGVGGGYGQNFYPQGGHGGGYVDKKGYSGENKNSHGDSFQKTEGSKGESGQHGSQGFSQGQVALKNVKGDSGSYNDQTGDKKSYTDGRAYQGGQQFNKGGGSGQGDNEKANHKKGYVKKGFKTSHHKDESGGTETFYDEAHDEGDSYRYGQNKGSFGTNGQSAYKGGHENGQFVADEKRKQGHYDQQHIVDNANADKGQYGQKGYHGNSEGYSVNNGEGQQSLLGRQEANRLYLNNHPQGYVPFYPGN